MSYVPIWARILIGAALAVFLAGWFAWKWRRASDYSNAEAAHEQARAQSFQAIRQDARFGWLCTKLAERYRVVIHGPPDPASHRLIYACFYGAQNEEVLAPGDGARSLCVFLRSESDCRVVSVDLATWQIHEQPLGWTFQMASMVPHFARA